MFNKFNLCKLWKGYSFFKKRGIKTPPFRFILGNLIDLKKERVLALVLLIM